MLAATVLRVGEPADALRLMEPIVQRGTPNASDYQLAGTAAVMKGEAQKV